VYALSINIPSQNGGDNDAVTSALGDKICHLPRLVHFLIFLISEKSRIFTVRAVSPKVVYSCSSMSCSRSRSSLSSFSHQPVSSESSNSLYSESPSVDSSSSNFAPGCQ
jgi:hypothetical protein